MPTVWTATSNRPSKIHSSPERTTASTIDYRRIHAAFWLKINGIIIIAIRRPYAITGCKTHNEFHVKRVDEHNKPNECSTAITN